jgi:hypothetical protein
MPCTSDALGYTTNLKRQLARFFNETRKPFRIARIEILELRDPKPELLRQTEIASQVLKE